MGGLCSKPAVQETLTPEERNERTARNIFNRFDKEGTGFITKENLQQLIQDDKAFMNTDVEHILQKFGDQNRLSFEQFKHWWNSTYTTYNDDNIKQILEELDAEGGPGGAADADDDLGPSPPRELIGDTPREKSAARLEQVRSSQATSR